MNPKVNKRARVITIACQISDGIKFLHDRNIVHGDINLHNILFDQHQNVIRLDDYGMYTHDSVKSGIHCRGDAVETVGNVKSEKCFIADLNSLAEILQLMMLSVSGEQPISYDVNKLAKLNPYVWPADDITSSIVDVVSECRNPKCDRKTSSIVNRKLRKILKLFRPALPLTSSVVLQETEAPVCLYCSVQPVHPELELRGTGCPETCSHLRACNSCMVNFGSHCYVDNDVCKHGDSLKSYYVEHICPVHQYPIEPMIGGVRSYAMILHDTSDSDIADNTDNNAMNMAQLARHPKIMRMPYENVHVISMPCPFKKKCRHETDSKCEKRCSCKDDSNCRKTCSCKTKLYLRVLKKIKQILDGKPSYFMFYYAGHELVQNNDKSKPLPAYRQLVTHLSALITDIAKTCPRILMIFDCCDATAVAQLFEIKLDDCAHVEWHVQWLSSCGKQDSNIEGGRQMSDFTKLVVSALSGGTERQCPHQNENCKMCSKYRRSCRENGCINIYESNDFVSEHMRFRQRKTHEHLSDVQNSMLKGSFVRKPVVAFFNKKSKLYTFFFQSTFDGGTVHKFQTDDLDVLDVWNMTVDHRPKDAHHVKFFQQYSMQQMQQLGDAYFGSTDMSSSEYNRILRAVSKDNKCLFVKIDNTSIESVDSDISVDSEDDDDDDDDDKSGPSETKSDESSSVDSEDDEDKSSTPETKEC